MDVLLYRFPSKVEGIKNTLFYNFTELHLSLYHITGIIYLQVQHQKNQNKSLIQVILKI